MSVDHSSEDRSALHPTHMRGEDIVRYSYENKRLSVRKDLISLKYSRIVKPSFNLI
jgi:hypothetical protein